MKIFKRQKLDQNNQNKRIAFRLCTTSVIGRKNKAQNYLSKIKIILAAAAFGSLSLTAQAETLTVGFHPTDILSDQLRCPDPRDAVNEATERLLILGAEVGLGVVLQDLNLPAGISSSQVAHLLLEYVADEESDPDDTIFRRAQAAGEAVLDAVGAIDCLQQIRGESAKQARDYIGDLNNAEDLQQLDVVVLTGIFTEEGRDYIIAEMAGDFPYHLVPDSVLYKTWDETSLPEGIGGLNPEDFVRKPPGSGFLLLSKLPLDPIFPYIDFEQIQSIGEHNTYDPKSKLRYIDNHGYFFGVYQNGERRIETGLLGIRVTHRGRPNYLFFSDLVTKAHTSEQLGNLQKAKAFMQQIVDWDMDFERVFFFVNTSLNGQGVTLARRADDRFELKSWPSDSSTDEYLATFGAGYYLHDLYDIWPAIAPVEDVGKTIESIKKDGRYTMMFAEPSREGGCVQHPKQLDMNLSENDLLMFEFANHHEFCTPADADVIPGDFSEAINPLISETYTINHRAHAVWMQVEAKNEETVSLRASSAVGDVITEVYGADNISEKLDPISRHVERGLTYTVPEKFYVKIFFEDEYKTGDIDIVLQRHDCASFEDKCALKPNEDQSSTKLVMPGLVTENHERDFFYELRFTNSGQFDLDQTLSINLDISEDRYLSYQLWKQEPDAEDPVIVNGMSENDFNHEITGQGVEFSGVDRKGGEYYLQVTVSQTDTYQLTANLYTDMTILSGGESFSEEERKLAIGEFNDGYSKFALTCHDETGAEGTDEWGSDEIKLDLKTDNRAFNRIHSASYNCDSGGPPKDFWAKNVAFKNNAVIQIQEYDSASDNEREAVTIQPLLFNQHLERKRVVFDDNDGEYSMPIELRAHWDGGLIEE